MSKAKKTALIAGAASLILGGTLVGLGQVGGSPEDFPKFNKGDVSVSAQGAKKGDKAEKKADERPGSIDLNGGAAKNLVEDKSDLIGDYCRNSKLPAGEGKDNKGGTCVSSPIGEVAKNPVRVSVDNAPSVVSVGKDFEVKVRVEDRFGPLDLNAFTFDESGGAGTTFLEHPGTLDKDGRPLLHCHLGVSTLSGDGLPGEDYDAAFSGVQGLKGNVSAKISGLERGEYRADVYCSQPGHAALSTAKATQVQAFDTFRFKVN